MNSFKRPNFVMVDHPIDAALKQARAKAEKEIFKQKVAANLIIGVALIVIFIMFFT